MQEKRRGDGVSAVSFTTRNGFGFSIQGASVRGSCRRDKIFGGSLVDGVGRLMEYTLRLGIKILRKSNSVSFEV